MTDVLTQHPQRMALHNEIHARPPEAMEAPVSLSHVVMGCDPDQRAASWAHLASLARDHHLPPPDAASTHVRLDLGPYRVRWEMHTEFVSWTFMRKTSADHFGEQEPEPALKAVPQRWFAQLLGLPAAREASSVLASAERELAELAQSIRSATAADEPMLLDRLTRLAGEVESQHAATHSRFSASAAYFELLDKRIAEIDESRLAGMQTIGEFMNRRLTPARSTCAWSARRQDALSQRVSRISNLLRTRVEIEQQQKRPGAVGHSSACTSAFSSTSWRS